jgi:IMP dehydrogenase
VPYAGRLKPNLRKDLLKIKAALSNVGAMDLKEYREKAVLERMSPFSSQIVNQPHNLIVKS